VSIETRQAVVNNTLLSFQDDSQKTDLLDPSLTQTELIAALQHLLEQGWPIQVTAVRSDHHDDTALDATPPYVGTHAHGWAIDMWPMDPTAPSQYLDAGDARFAKFLTDCSHVPYYLQTGLGGTADTAINQVAAGAGWFADGYTDANGAWVSQDHVHLGTQT
jgi:hypothetical protein